METITLTDDKTRPNDQAMFPPTKLQQFIDMAKTFLLIIKKEND